MPHPWKHSKPGWTGPWAISSSGRCPCSLQGCWIRWPLKVPSILWFHDSMILKMQPGVRIWTPVMILHHGILLSAWLSLTHRCYDPSSSAGFWGSMPPTAFGSRILVFWLVNSPVCVTIHTRHYRPGVSSWDVFPETIVKHLEA